MTSLKKTACKMAKKLPTVLWAASFSVGLATTSLAETSTRAIINACNFAPYAINLHWVVPEADEHGSTPLAAGECNSISQMTGHASKNTRLFAEPASSLSYEYVKHKDWYKRFWGDLGIQNTQWPSAQADGLIYCAGNSSRSLTRADRSNNCPSNTQARFYSAPLNFDENDRADWVMLDFALCSRFSDLDCYNASLEELGIWAADMSDALHRLYQYRNPSSGRAGLIPSIAGIVLEDTNRMFNHGIEVVSAEKSTPFGTPIQLRPGDEILFFNGHKVFGQDIAMLVFEAGKRYGYNHVNEVVFRRNGQTYSTGLALYFDEYAYGNIFKLPNGNCREPLVATALSALNEFQFYNQSEFSCMMDEMRNPGSISQSKCVFERDQFIAAIKQFCPKEAFTGEMIGGLAFIGSNLVDRAVPVLIPAVKGKSLYSRSARALLREIGEETFRTIRTQPPGVNTQAVIDDIIARGQLQGAIGVGFQVAPRITGALLVPMIYNTYQQL